MNIKDILAKAVYRAPGMPAGKLLRVMREQAGMSRSLLAKRTEISETRLRAFELDLKNRKPLRASEIQACLVAIREYKGRPSR